MPEQNKTGTIIRSLLSVLFALLGCAAVAVVVYVCVKLPSQPPMLLTQPEAAKNTVTAMMDSVCQGDYREASGYILGNPDFGVDREPEDELGALFWDALLESMEYELVGECYTTETGLAQDVTFTCLDLNSVTTVLRQRSQALLEQRVQEAEDTGEIYDEENNYREDVVLEVLLDAARMSIEEDGKSVTVELTVNLKYRDGRWWVVADKALLDAISGSVLF